MVHRSLIEEELVAQLDAHGAHLKARRIVSQGLTRVDSRSGQGPHATMGVYAGCRSDRRLLSTLSQYAQFPLRARTTRNTSSFCSQYEELFKRVRQLEKD